MTCADFIVSTPDYFRYNPADEFITPEQIEEIASNTKASLSGTVFVAARVSVRLIPPALVFRHYRFGCQIERVSSAGRYQSNEFSQIRWPCVTRGAALHALTADQSNLGFTHRSNLGNPHIRGRRPVLLGPPVRKYFPHDCP